MVSLALLMMILCILAAIAMMGGYQCMGKAEQKQVLRLKDSSLYQNLRRRMADLPGGMAVDQVRVESTGVNVTSVLPAHVLLRYSFRKNGGCCRNRDAARHMALALGEDFPLLSDRRYYTLTRYRIYRFNGQREFGYIYTIRRAVKDQVIEQASSAAVRTY